MELYTIITILCIILSFMLSPSTSHQVMAQSSNIKAYAGQVTPPALPRKLKINEEVMVEGSGHKKDVVPFNKPSKVLSSGKSYGKEAKTIRERKGTRKEWVENDSKSEFFTMDYSQVRRRPPIHNKSVPVAP